MINLLKGLAKTARGIFHDAGAEKGMGWLDVKRLKHYSTGPERVYKYKDKEIRYVNPYDLYLAFQEIFIDGIYQCRIPAKGLVLDCGANIGLATLCIKEQHPECRVVAFEPDEKNHALLAKNVASWNFRDVEIRKQAVWKENTTLTFASTGDMASKISGTGNGVQVDAVRLRDFLQEKVAFLKLDIEGAEYEVLKDIRDRLHMVDLMFFEYHGRFEETANLADVFSILNEGGFHFYIKEAADLYHSPFNIRERKPSFDVQLNIFCFRNNNYGKEA